MRPSGKSRRDTGRRCSRKSQVASRKSQVASHKSQVASHKSHVASHKRKSQIRESPVARHRPVGPKCACISSSMAKTVDGLQVYQKAMAAAAEIFALLDRPVLQRDLQLRSQLNAASIRVPSDVSEGFAQK